MATMANVGLPEFAWSLCADEPKPSDPPLVRAVFLRTKEGRRNMGWPGKGYDIDASQETYTTVMTKAARKLDVRLEVEPGPVGDIEAVNRVLESCKRSRTDGVILIVMGLAPTNYWTHATHFVKNRGDIPTVVFSPIGTSFLDNIQQFPKLPKTFVASTQDVQWLELAMRMLNAIQRMKETRICVLQGDKTEELVVKTLGTTLHYIPHTRFPEEYKRVEASDEVRAIAEYYTRNARTIVEPSKDDVLNMAKCCLAARRILAAEHCHGFAIDCLPMVQRLAAPPPCLALSRCLDEGIAAACQADWPGALSLRLTHLLTDRPGFLQNIVVNTVNNTLVGAHCTCATKLDGYDKPAAPFSLRSHTESDLGVAAQVYWRVGQEITITKFSDQKWWGKPSPEELGSAGSALLLGSGRVVCNIDTPPSGGCRTSVEVALEGVEDVTDLRFLHHQLFIYGNHTRLFRAYAQLAGLQVASISKKGSSEADHACHHDGQEEVLLAHASGSCCGCRASTG
jgi:hypothetical protein